MAADRIFGDSHRHDYGSGIIYFQKEEFEIEESLWETGYGS